LSDVYFFSVLALAAVGAVLAGIRGWRDRRSSTAALVVLFVTLAGAAVPVLAFGDTRFKVPLAPCLAVLAAVTVCSVVQWWSARRPVEAQ
jgi:hypothetical protein